VSSPDFDHFGYVITDAVLYHPHLSNAAKIVLAGSLAYPNRDPSFTQLEMTLPITRQHIGPAQRELESAGIVRYARSEKRIGGDGPRAKHRDENNRIVWVANEAEPQHPSNDKRVVRVPSRVAARLPRGTKNASLYPLLALHYTGAQLRQLAIQVEDNAAAWLLGASPKQIARARKAFITAGVLLLARRVRPATIYTLPDATTTEPNPNQVDPSKTRRLLDLKIGEDQPVRLYGSESELAEAARVANGLEPCRRAVAWLRMVSARGLAKEAFERNLTPSQALIERLIDEGRWDGDEEGVQQHVEGVGWPLPDGAYPASHFINALTKIAVEELQIISFDDLSPASPDCDENDNLTVEHPLRARPRVVESTVLVPPTSEEKAQTFTRSAREVVGDESKGAPWPPGTTERATTVFGEKATRAGTKTHAILNEQIAHALRVWRAKYAGGLELSPEQVDLADELLATAVAKIGRLHSDRARYRALTHHRSPILAIVNDDATHERFRRLPTPEIVGDGLIDASAEVRAALAEIAAAQGGVDPLQHS
jgi:hypothetical protein